MFETELIKLSYLPNKTSKRLRQLCFKVSDLKSFLNLKEVQKALTAVDDVKLQGDLKYIKDHQINLLSFFDECYPESLRQISDFPLMLYCAGEVSLLTELKTAIVGSRVPNFANIKLVESLSSYLNEHDVVVVSGFARGIDTVAHYNAAKTIAVFGTGVDVCYPKENQFLYNNLKSNALCISEFPIGTKPFKFNFPARNRIIAALSPICIIVEAKLNSGSMITARLALEYGKEIFAVPGHPSDVKVQGTNKLIKDGAHMLTDFIELLEVLSRKVHFESSVQLTVNNEELKIEKSVDDCVNKDEKGVLDLLSEEGCEYEDIAAHLNIDATSLNQILATLELQDRIYKDGFGKVCRKL